MCSERRKIAKNKVTEKELIAGCKHGDRSSLQELYEKYAPKMLGVCLRYVPNREIAKDLMHDGFITLFSNIESYRGDGSFEGWIRRIFVNTALSHYRKNNVLENASEVDSIKQFDNNEADALSGMSSKELLECISHMPEGYRVVLNLFAIEGYSHKEIAQMLNISEGTSRSQFLRAKQHLRKVLKQTEIA